MEVDGVVLCVVACLVQVADALGDGQPDYMNGWVTALENLYFYNGDNVWDYIVEHMPWLFNNRPAFTPPRLR